MYDGLVTFILNVFMSLVSVWIVKNFLGIYFEIRKRKFLVFLLWTIYSLFHLMAETLKGNGSLWNMAVSIVVVFFIVLCGYERAGKIKLFHIILLHALWVIVEIFTFFILNLLTIKGVESMILGTIVSKILMIIIINLLSLFQRRNRNYYIPATYYFMLLFIPISSIFIAVNEFHSGMYWKYKISTTLTISILLLINIIIFEIYLKLGAFYELDKEKTVYEQQINLISRNIEEQKRIMDKFYEEKHNLTNQLISLKENIKNNDCKRAIDELNDIINIQNNIEDFFSTGNSVVDALINNIYAIAKEKGISFHLNVFIPESLTIKQSDLGIIIGNALDNAIEATELCENYNKEIKISMGIKKGALVIVITNPYEHTLKRENSGKLLSTKSDGHKHGYGVSSLDRIVDKYDGNILIETEYNYFKITFVLNIPNF